MKKNVIFIIVFIALLVLSAYLIFANIDMRNAMRQLDSLKEKELLIKIEQAKKDIEKSFDERHRADKVSYEAMAKSLELENKKVSELEDKLKTLSKPTTKPAKKK